MSHTHKAASASLLSLYYAIIQVLLFIVRYICQLATMFFPPQQMAYKFHMNLQKKIHVKAKNTLILPFGFKDFFVAR